MAASVTLIYVSWNSAGFIRSAMDSALALDFPSEQRRIVVVDNGSQDETVAILRAEYPQITLIAEPINHGFAKANNIAMQRYPADYFALINTDVRLERPWLKVIIAAMEADSSIGVAGCKIFHSNGLLLQHTGAMIRPNLLTYHLGANEFDLGQHDQPRECDYVMGAACVVRGRVAAKVGYLHEGYFMYYEETELCYRARQAGHKVLYLPKAVAIHDERHSLSRRPSLKYLWRYHRSRYLFAMRNLTTSEQRRAFCDAERAWWRESARDVRYRVLMWAARRSHGALLREHPWLAHLRA
ncbi:MAG: hypothetical protein OHK0023_08390 [Anaerolineae bacterium]